MIRLITPDDSATVIALAVASGLFPADGTEVLDKMLAGYFDGNFDDSHRCVLDVEAEPLGVAYYAPKTATDRTWELIMIGVRHDTQGKGRGTALLNYVENALRLRVSGCCWSKHQDQQTSSARERSIRNAATKPKHAFAIIIQRAKT